MSRNWMRRGLCVAAAGGTLMAEALAVRAAAFELAEQAIGWHVLASVLGAAVGLLAGMDWLDRSVARSAARASLVAFLLTLCLPVVGACVVALVIFPGMLRERRTRSNGVLELAPPAPEGGGEGELGSDADARSEDNCEAGGRGDETSKSERSAAACVRSISAAGAMDGAVAVRIWVRALRDERDEVRLLAHALLERREKSLRRTVDQVLARLQPDCESDRLPDACRHRLLLRVAEVHWELVRCQLVHRELAGAELQQVFHFASAAWSAKPSGGSALLLGRAWVHSRRGEEALHWLAEAEYFGVARPVLAPLRAEAAFLLRRYADLGQMRETHRLRATVGAFGR